MTTRLAPRRKDLDRAVVADAAAHLNLEGRLGDEALNDRQVEQHALLRAVEVDDVKPLGAGGGELFGLCDGVVGVVDLPLEVALEQPNTTPLPQINCRKYVHR